ncbi:hypothetical protein Zmor_010349 [Zophobas morio]|uniref:Uncharacterized protein n=1 Tax=Zophobas morio TaxID=2755281 RepID=A0AA38IKI3_9CUCU|nr:hypothetical protein Zmor_023252 [Zophobas morio]KAJ3658620.1 hypothetical protein Zmor_010349 [Zophobas morio]
MTNACQTVEFLVNSTNFQPHLHRPLLSELPIDTPEVQQARAAHLAALSQAQTHHYRIRRGIIHESYVPEETPEVQVARYQHLVAHASAHDEDDDDYYHAPHEDLYHIPILTKKGVPVNTASVKAARQQHRLAHQLAKSGVQYSGGHSVHEPVIAPNGVPFDTPEVYIAKAEHLAAHADESTKHNQWGLHSGYGGGYGF